MVAIAEGYCAVNCINCDNTVERIESRGDKSFKCTKCGIEWVVEYPRFICDTNINMLTPPQKFIRYRPVNSVHTQMRLMETNVIRGINKLLGHQMFSDYQIVKVKNYLKTENALRSDVKKECLRLVKVYNDWVGVEVFKGLNSMMRTNFVNIRHFERQYMKMKFKNYEDKSECYFLIRDYKEKMGLKPVSQSMYKSWKNL